MRYLNSEITKLELAEIVDDVICRVKALEDKEAASTSTNNARDEILPGQCPACHGCGNVMVSHVNECRQCGGTGKTSSS